MAFGNLTPTDNSELRIIFNTSVHEHIKYATLIIVIVIIIK